MYRYTGTTYRLPHIHVANLIHLEFLYLFWFSAILLMCDVIISQQTTQMRWLPQLKMDFTAPATICIMMVAFFFWLLFFIIISRSSIAIGNGIFLQQRFNYWVAFKPYLTTVITYVFSCVEYARADIFMHPKVIRNNCIFQRNETVQLKTLTMHRLQNDCRCMCATSTPLLLDRFDMYPELFW